MSQTSQPESSATNVPSRQLYNSTLFRLWSIVHAEMPEVTEHANYENLKRLYQELEQEEAELWNT